MKRLLLFIVCIFSLVLIGFGQNQKVPIKTVSNKTVQVPSKQPLNVNKIPETEWNEIVKAYKAEDWDKTSLLVSGSLKRLKTENDTKQLARLRYLSLYSLAGKVVQGKATYEDLEKNAEPLIGQEFLMPSREISADCVKKLNYICPMADSDKVLRVTAINNAATSIISFEYVQMAEKFDVATNIGKQIFLGGTLKRIELNPNDKSTAWVMRLVFENGFGLLVKK